MWTFVFFILEISQKFFCWLVDQQTLADISIQIGKDKFIEKNDKFIVSFGLYKGVFPYWGKNDTVKMVDTINNNDIRR